MLQMINSKENLYGDNIAKVEQYDFSRANSSDEARTLTITSIAVICTQKFESIGSEKLCTKLLTEAHGIPSSAYGFVPVLLTNDDTRMIWEKAQSSRHSYPRWKSGIVFKNLHIEKFGEEVENGRYLLTNLRALVNDIGLEASKEFYNTDENEIAIIKKHFKVFKHKMDIISARQFLRHTTAIWQELSRRYVSGKKVPFEFYVCESMKKVKWTKTLHFSGDFGSEYTEKVDITTQQLIDDSVEHYFQALEQGVKPQQARYIIHPCVYTEIWSGWQPFALQNMLTERTAGGTQWELRQTALAIKELINE